MAGSGDGWRAAEPGPQRIRIIFDVPQNISRIYVAFVEESGTRTQEFVIRWKAARDECTRDVVRQQYTFTPLSSEVEDYSVDLKDAILLELEITPSIGGEAVASLTELRLK